MATDDRWRAVLLFGMPGSGKGTQGKALGCLPGLLHVATGDIFRGLDLNSSLGRDVAVYTTAGKLVPDELTVQLWRDHVRSLAKQGKFNPESDVLVMDGIPRTHIQAGLIDRDIRVLRIFNLKLVDIEEAVRRMRTRALKENRLDDADETVIRGRLATFQRETAQTLGFYPPSLVQEIDALCRPIDVLCNVAHTIAKLTR